MAEVLQGRPAEGQPPAGSESPAGSAQQESKPTLDEARIREIATEVAQRTAQSLVDKGTDRISRQVAERIQALEMTQKSLGLTDEQVAAARQKIVVDAITEEPKPQSREPASSQSAPLTASTTGTDPMLEAAIAMMTAQGTQIDEGDPEYAKIKPHLEGPRPDPKLLTALQEAIIAKQQRLASLKQNADARVTGAGGSGIGGMTYNPQESSLSLLEKARGK